LLPNPVQDANQPGFNPGFEMRSIYRPEFGFGATDGDEVVRTLWSIRFPLGIGSGMPQTQPVGLSTPEELRGYGVRAAAAFRSSARLDPAASKTPKPLPVSMGATVLGSGVETGAASVRNSITGDWNRRRTEVHPDHRRPTSE
jgi:hypothetical protein